MSKRTSLSRLAALFGLWSLLALSLSGCGAGAPMETQAPLTPPPASAVEATPLPPTPSLPAVTATAAFPPPTPQPVQPALLETRRLTLEFPTRIRAGTISETVRLTLEVDDMGNVTPTAERQGNIVTGEVITIPDLYDTHNVLAEARLDLAGMTVQPSGTIYEPLKRGESVTFRWSIAPQTTGTYRGTIWLHLKFTNRSTGEEDRIPVSAQLIEIKTVDFFGFSVDFVRSSGVVGSVLGAIIGFPFLEDALKFLFARKHKTKKKK